jgi:hypothetical protein
MQEQKQYCVTFKVGKTVSTCSTVSLNVNVYAKDEKAAINAAEMKVKNVIPMLTWNIFYHEVKELDNDQ